MYNQGFGLYIDSFTRLSEYMPIYILEKRNIKNPIYFFIQKADIFLERSERATQGLAVPSSTDILYLVRAIPESDQT